MHHNQNRGTRHLWDGVTPFWKLILRKILKFNSQMTAFGATNIVQSNDAQNFESTIKIQGQAYRHIGSLMAMHDVYPKFLQNLLHGRWTRMLGYKMISQLYPTYRGKGNSDIVGHFWTITVSWPFRQWHSSAHHQSRQSASLFAGLFKAPTMIEVAVGIS